MGKKERKREAEAHGAREQAEKALVLEIIERAFDGVPPPDGEHRTLLQAEAWDEYQIVDQRRDHKGRWQDVPEEHLHACPNAIFHLDEQGIRYYLPALMSFCIVSPEKRHGNHLGPLIHGLGPAGEGLGEHRRRQLSLLTPPQREAVLRFLEHVGAPPEDIQPWRRAVAVGDDPS